MPAMPALNGRRLAIVHTVLSALAIMPSIGLAIGLTIGAADANIGVLGNVLARMAVSFPVVLFLSVPMVWIACATAHQRVAQAAVGVAWGYLVVLLAFAAITFGLTG